MRGCTWLVVGASLALAGCECDFFNSNDDPDAGGRTNRGVGESCTDNEECRSSLRCIDESCQPTGTGTDGSACVLSGDCGDGLFCDSARRCVLAGEGGEGSDCDFTGDCQAGLICTIEGFGRVCRSAGANDLGRGCDSTLDCLAGLTCVRTGGTTSCQSAPAMEITDGGVAEPPVIPLWPGEVCEEDEGPPTAYFQVPRGDGSDQDFYRLPFPNDVRRTSSGLNLEGHPSPGTALSLDILGRYIERSETDLDGFSTNPVIYFRFSQPYEWGDINGDRVLLIDITESSPQYGINLGRVWLTTAGRITRYICPNWLGLRREHGAPLQPGTTYAALLLRGIRNEDGLGHEVFERASDLDALLAEAAPSDEQLTQAHEAYAPLRAWLAGDDTPDVDSVLNATVFTTQNPRAMVPALREAIREQDAPTLSMVTLCDGETESPCHDGGLRQCSAPNDDFHEIHALISLPQFQTGTPPYETPEDGGGIAVNSEGTPQISRTDSVCMVMTVPKVETPPAEGFPLVVYGHGTGGAFTSPVANGLAAIFATDDAGSGVAQAVTVAIDMPLHGTRRGESDRDPDVLVFNFINPRAARDNFLQGAADLMAVYHWAEGFSLDAEDSPTGFAISFNPGRMTYWGHSQGATHGGLMLPYERVIAAAVLSGMGGDLTMSLLNKTEPTDIAGTVPVALLDADSNGNLAGGDYHPALALFQSYFERVDPVNFGTLLWREAPEGPARHVFMTYGVGDSFTPEETQRAYARAVRFTQVMPQIVDIPLGDSVAPPLAANRRVGETDYTIGLRQYMPNEGDDGHFVSTRTEQGRADTTRFMLNALTGAVPAVGE